MRKIMHPLFFTVLTALILFHNNTCGMQALIANGATNYRASKDAWLKHPTVNVEKLAENISLQPITAKTSFLHSDIVNFALHCPPGLIGNQEKIKELTLKPKIRIFFSDSPLLDEEDKILECRDDEDKTHTINKHDLGLFCNDIFTPSIYTNLIPQELVEKDRTAIKTFILCSKRLKKEKQITVPQPLIKNIFIPALCFNIHAHLSDTFKRIETIFNPNEINDIENEDCREFFNLFLKDIDKIFASKTEYLMNNFNFTVAQKIIGHYFVKEHSK